MKQKIEKASLDDTRKFMAQKDIAIAGVSRNTKKFGNVIFKDPTYNSIYPSLKVDTN